MYEVRVIFRQGKVDCTVYFEGPIAATEYAKTMSRTPQVACVIVQDVAGLQDPQVFEEGGQVD